MPVSPSKRYCLVVHRASATASILKSAGLCLFHLEIEPLPNPQILSNEAIVMPFCLHSCFIRSTIEYHQKFLLIIEQNA